MSITIQVDSAAMQLAIRSFRDQAAFAISRAINTTALGAQAAQVKHQRDVFTVRRADFVDRAVKIKPFATKRSLVAVLSIDPPGGQARADILTKFEEGTPKVPRGPRLAVPDGARRGKTGGVEPSLRPRALNFQPYGASGRVMRGDKRTVLIRLPGGRGGIYQRRGVGKRSTLFRLFVFTPRAKTPRVLDFEKTIEASVRANFKRNFEIALAEAIRTAR